MSSMNYIEILISLIVIYIIYRLLSKNDNNMNNNENKTTEFNWNGFSFQLGLSESSNNYKAVNSIGALGKYQFMPTTIRDISNRYNLSVPSKEEFLNSPDLQEKYFKIYVNELKSYMEKNLSSYLGKNIIGKSNNISTKINMYGLIGGGWLGGAGGVYNYLVHNIDRSDGRTYISDYIAKFSNLVK